MTSLLLLALLSTAAPPKVKPKPVDPPHRLALPANPTFPLVGSPCLTPDGKTLVFARFAVPHPVVLQRDGHLFEAKVAKPSELTALKVLGPNVRNHFRAKLSLDGEKIAYLAQGELWVRPLADGTAERLYPPKEGSAPLGPALSHFAWGPDASWLLIQSPTGWARIAVAGGELAPLSLTPIDLSNGSLALRPDGRHVVFVRPRSGPGWENGARVITQNLETGQAQLADFDHDYTEVLALTDDEILGKDPDGALWALRGRTRLPYFRPPNVPKGSSVGQYVVSGDLTQLAYVVSQGNGFSFGRSELWVGPAPTPPSRKAHLPGPGEDRH